MEGVEKKLSSCYASPDAMDYDDDSISEMKEFQA